VNWKIFLCVLWEGVAREGAQVEAKAP